MNIKLILIVVAIIGSIILTVMLKIRKSKEKELKMIAEDKLRDQALNKALANELCNKEKVNVESLPYEVDYTQQQLGGREMGQDKIMLQITAYSELSKRKFMIELKERVRIGKAKENEVVIKEAQVLPLHCEIFRYQNAVYVKDLSSGHTILNRKKQRVYIDSKGLRLKTGDRLLIEDMILEVNIIDQIE